MNTIASPPKEFKPLQNGTAKSGIINCPSGNELFNLVSEMTKISTLPLTCSVRKSKLFLNEFIFSNEIMWLRFFKLTNVRV